MRIDAAAVFAHSIASVPLRMILAWGIGTLGAFTPIFLQGGVEALEAVQWRFFFFPLYIFFLPFVSGWWGVVTFPLLLVLFWKLLRFLRDDTTTIELAWMFLLPFLITIRVSGDRLPWAILIAIAVVIAMVRYYRHHREAEF